MHMKARLYLPLAALLATMTVQAQDTTSTSNDDKFTISGSIQSDVLIPQEDKAIGTDKYNEWALTNTYADIAARSSHIDAGLRFEFTKHPLPGYASAPEGGFKGYGVPHFYVKTHFDNWDLTLGTFYEQFGSGFILRTYEERSLGIDNSLLGGRLVVRPVKGVQVKALAGKQRHYWKWNSGWVSGADLELNVDEWFKALQDHGTYLTLGASWVNKYQAANEGDIMVDATHMLRFPRNVNAFDVRANLQAGNFNLLAEYAWKTDDPSYDNKYIYRTGKVAMLSASYSKKGFSVLAQAKRSDDMSFRSDRNVYGLSSNINNLPAFTQEQTYTLAALYPYATRPDGEWAFQGEVGYKFKGRYAPSFKLNYSHVFAIDKSVRDGGGYGTDGYGSSFFKCGETYYRDFNVQYEQKYNRSFKLSLMYMNQYYNNDVLKAIEREDDAPVADVLNHIFVADGKWTISKKTTLRAEAQYMKSTDGANGNWFKWNSNGAQGDWLFGLLELSVLPNWMFTVSDLYNAGETNRHYYQGLVTFTHQAHRLQVGYGRTRSGYNCTGGVCRWIPASKGVTISYNYNF